MEHRLGSQSSSPRTVPWPITRTTRLGTGRQLQHLKSWKQTTQKLGRVAEPCRCLGLQREADGERGGVRGSHCAVAGGGGGAERSDAHGGLVRASAPRTGECVLVLYSFTVYMGTKAIRVCLVAVRSVVLASLCAILFLFALEGVVCRTPVAVCLSCWDECALSLSEAVGCFLNFGMRRRSARKGWYGTYCTSYIPRDSLLASSTDCEGAQR